LPVSMKDYLSQPDDLLVQTDVLDLLDALGSPTRSNG
jgi:hypothetical protein